MTAKRCLVLLTALCIVMMTVGCSKPAGDQGGTKELDYPTRNIEVIVGWGAGGGTDLFTRVIVEPLKDILGVPVVVVNMPGASSAEAASYVQEQPADGYTLFAVTSDILTNNALGRSEYGAKDFTPLIRAHVDVGMIHASANSQFKTWEDLIEYGKENQGELIVGGIGAVSFDEIATIMVFQEAGVKIKFVPYEEAGQMHAALLGGHLDAMYEEPGPALSMIEAKEIVPLITTAEKRLDKFPDVPSVSDYGYKTPPWIWRGVVVKKGTPDEIVKKLEAAFKQAYESEAYKNFEKERLLDLFPGYLGTEGFAEVMENEYDIFDQAFKSLGYK
jgi:putative tricarboxylic transport membrane protein